MSKTPTSGRRGSSRGRRRAPEVRRALVGPATVRHRARSKLFTLAVILVVPALTVATSVPTALFLGRIEPVADVASAQLVEAQSLQVSSELVAGQLARDQFEALSYAEVLKLKYSGLDYTFSGVSGDIQWPFPERVPISDGFGYRGTEFHYGIDLMGGNGTPIYAIADGVVNTARYDPTGFGQHVKISHNLGGVLVESVYGHMIQGSSPIEQGQEVAAGTFLGLLGSTGRSTGPHLHLEIRVDGVPVDPMEWMTANAVGW
jgi:murein DD-endopeptidase MepM/ murein hydrolase activator NlpD